jgi:hypothetical protein
VLRGPPRGDHGPQAKGESGGQRSQSSSRETIAIKMSEWPAHCLYQAKLPVDSFGPALFGGPLEHGVKRVDVGAAQMRGRIGALRTLSR